MRYTDVGCIRGTPPGVVKEVVAVRSSRRIPPPDFFVRVEGDSLDKVGFTTGDIIAVRHQPEARNGDIVLARIGEEVPLKRYERIGPHTVEFQPASTNPEHQPIRVDARTEDVAIVGIVVGAIIGTRRAAG